MTVLKHAQRSATLSFAPGAGHGFLAAGSVAGAIDLSFSSSSQLEIFRVDFADDRSELKLAGAAVTAPERFCRVAWGLPGADAKTYPYGLIAGGLADGSVCVWNPARIIGQAADAKPTSPAGGRGAMLARLQKHAGAVKGLEFNTFSPNLLASGGGDGELCIWDVGNPMQPSLYPAMKGGTGGAAPQPEITHLAWNRKVQHILGTCTAAGTVVVWDLKKQRPVISFKDPSGRKRCSALQWNPEVATQLIVASDDDMSPALQLWDLRNSVSPVREFHGHAKGVLGMSWCPQDSSFLMSSGKDNRTICWDVSAGEMYCELPAATNWNFDVQWAPGQLAGVFATATFEGQIALSSLSACTAVGGEADGFSIGQAVPMAAKVKAPAWLMRPVSAAFGFGGKLVQVSNSKRQLPTGEIATTGSVTISQVLTEPDLVQRSEAFEQAIRGGDREALSAFCHTREQQVAGSEEAETWAFLQTHFAADGRKFLLDRLGFEQFVPALLQPESEAAAAADEAAAAAAAAALLGGDAAAAGDAAAGGMQQLSLEQQAAAEQLLAGDGTEFFEHSPTVDGTAFFDNLATPPRPTPLSPTDAAKRSVPASPREPAIVDGPPGENEEAIQKLLFAGNYIDAVDACLDAKRHADALVVASVAGGDLWEKARKAYMTAHPRPFMRVLHAVLSGDWGAFITARHPAAWRETLAAILTSAPYDQFEVLLGQLAARLGSANMAHAATLCYICAGDVDAAVRQWGKAAVKDGQSPSVQALEALMEKAVVLGIGVNRQSAGEALSDLIVRYAELLAANGRLGIALEYLQMVPGEPSASVAALKDRLYQAALGSTQLPEGVPPPPFPFAAEDVSQNSYQQQTAAAPAYGAQQQYGGYGAAQQQQQQQQQQYGGYGAASQNGYGAAAPTPTYGASAAGQPTYGASAASQSGYGAAALPSPAAQAPAQPQQFASYGGGYGSAPAAPTQPAYQPTPAAGSYGGASPRTTASMAPHSQQPAVFQPAAAPAAAAAPPPTVYGQQQAAQAYALAPAAAPPPPPTSYGQQQQMQQQAAPVAPQAPPQVYQPAPAAATVYQQQPAAPAAVYQPAAAPAARLAPTTSGQMPSPSFVPQQGPPAAAQQQGAPPRSGPTPTPITAPPPPPPGPPANITLANADTSSVPAQLKPVVVSLSGLYKVCEQGAGAHPGKRREVEDSSKKLGALFWKLNKGEVSPSVGGKLLQLCQALDAGDFVTATHVQVSLTTSDWDECSHWLTALKRLIKARHQMG
ncbi:transport SEC31-like protein B isoform B [Micractinium conductrix]|uniref:Transport SEC31-like protein B isoform B n=1 Tax=Micractinium conductrix TaxID=554055 RepID=A0A2P6VQ15_9CHLO|nr:transport SEC31-like protein B isoform B [Micractinium conductrix]|eukprot:PSC76171.1 transport SEC31-like protein B isoform B [Micractinium conductrix]